MKKWVLPLVAFLLLLSINLVTSKDYISNGDFTYGSSGWVRGIDPAWTNFPFSCMNYRCANMTATTSYDTSIYQTFTPITDNVTISFNYETTGSANLDIYISNSTGIISNLVHYGSNTSGITTYTNTLSVVGLNSIIFYCGVTSTDYCHVDDVSIVTHTPHYITTKKAVCERFIPTSLSDENQTYTCDTTGIDTTDCSDITGVRGNLYLETVNNTPCVNYSTPALNLSYIFQTTQHEYNIFPFCILNMPQNESSSFGMTANAISVAYLNKIGVFSSCSFYYNYTFRQNNITPYKLYCDLEVDCAIDTSSLGTSCSSYCEDGYQYINGTYDTTSGLCVNFTSILKCQSGFCGSSLTSCGETVISGNPTPLYELNTTALTKSYLNLLFSPMGIVWAMLEMLQGVIIFYTGNEELGLLALGILSFGLGYLGIITSWLGYLTAFLIFEIMVLKGVKIK